jgi:hypothetical protein
VTNTTSIIAALQKLTSKVNQPGFSAKTLAAMTPQHPGELPANSEISLALRQGRSQVEALFDDTLVGDKLTNLLAETDTSKRAIEELLNRPFPEGESISIELLDLIVARLQQLEMFNRLLLQVFVEHRWPSAVNLPSPVCETSAVVPRQR